MAEPKAMVAGADGPWPVPEHWPYSHAVVVGDLLHFSGQVAFDEELRLVGPGDIAVQTRQVWRNVQRILEHAGGKVTDVISVTTYLEDRSLIEPAFVVRTEFFADGRFPATTDVIVAGPSMPGFLLEMQGTAMIGCS